MELSSESGLNERKKGWSELLPLGEQITSLASVCRLVHFCFPCQSEMPTGLHQACSVQFEKRQIHLQNQFGQIFSEVVPQSISTALILILEKSPEFLK